jgi:hypothetical protein
MAAVGTGAWLVGRAASAASVPAAALPLGARLARRAAAPLTAPLIVRLDALTDRLDALSRLLVPRVVDAVLDRLDLTALVLTRVDLHRLLAAAPVEEVVDRVDVDAVADRLNVAAVLDRLDLTAIVLERVDLSRLLAAAPIDEVVERVDVDAVVSRVDVDAVAARLDVDAVAARLDVETFLDRLDLVGIAREVLDDIDLPEIIRESTGAMASETVRGVRMQGITADERISAAVDRLLGRRGRRRGDVPAVAGATEIPAQRAEPWPEDAPPPLPEPPARP